MDCDGPKTVLLTVNASAWRDVVDGLGSSEALLAFAERVVQATLERAALAPWLKSGEVSLLLTDDDEIRELNTTYRAKDRATNVLSFHSLDLIEGETGMAPPPAPAMLGDIIISHQRLMVEAEALAKSRSDHFAHLLVHGTLHLLGYDHEDDRQAELMEGLEAEILKSLGFAAPYAPEGEAASPLLASRTAS